MTGSGAIYESGTKDSGVISMVPTPPTSSPPAPHPWNAMKPCARGPASGEAWRTDRRAAWINQELSVAHTMSTLIRCEEINLVAAQINTYSGLLQQLAHSREHMSGDENTPSVELVISQVVWDEELFHDDSHDGLLQQLALGGECWNGEKMICIRLSWISSTGFGRKVIRCKLAKKWWLWRCYYMATGIFENRVVSDYVMEVLGLTVGEQSRLMAVWLSSPTADPVSIVACAMKYIEPHLDRLPIQLRKWRISVGDIVVSVYPVKSIVQRTGSSRAFVDIPIRIKVVSQNNSVAPEAVVPFTLEVEVVSLFVLDNLDLVVGDQS
ncbi:unnamed protein product [Miscanthus lutarioriparius]|uniref:Uncharacterized protein n=1 Tax=Miscanthus lutarioriparius TaxID=422564 RepID=A0A811RE22_9POAL|nr:unnamed protein product [Miscanthus lutarioriparius]